jgi:hypothetical protein
MSGWAWLTVVLLCWAAAGLLVALGFGAAVRIADRRRIRPGDQVLRRPDGTCHPVPPVKMGASGWRGRAGPRQDRPPTT